MAPESPFQTGARGADVAGQGPHSERPGPRAALPSGNSVAAMYVI